LPVTGIPDRDKHKLCIRCHKWHEPTEGQMTYPADTGGQFSPIFDAARRISDGISGDTSAMKFICNRCVRMRRIRWGILVGILVALCLLAVILGRLGVI
jgi:hypothetical protein